MMMAQEKKQASIGEIEVFRLKLEAFVQHALGQSFPDAAAAEEFRLAVSEQRTSLMYQAEVLGLSFSAEASRIQESVLSKRKESKS